MPAPVLADVWKNGTPASSATPANTPHVLSCVSTRYGHNVAPYNGSGKEGCNVQARKRRQVVECCREPTHIGQLVSGPHEVAFRANECNDPVLVPFSQLLTPILMMHEFNLNVKRTRHNASTTRDGHGQTHQGHDNDTTNQHGFLTNALPVDSEFVTSPTTRITAAFRQYIGARFRNWRKDGIHPVQSQTPTRNNSSDPSHADLLTLS